MKTLIVKKALRAKRIDKFLKEKYPGISRALVQQAIKKGMVRVNKKKIKPNYLLKEKDRIEIAPKCFRRKKLVKISPNPCIKLPVLFENQDFLVIDKPAGILVHPGQKPTQNTIANALIAYNPKIRNVGEHPLRPGIVHRLDKDTSGLVLVAKNNQAFLRIKSLFKKRLIEKRYLALVYGRPKKRKGQLKSFLYRSQKDGRKRIALDFPKKNLKMKEALASYQVLKIYSNGKKGFFSLLELVPKTGRTHQIRSQLHALGHPIVGDELYRFKNLAPVKGLKGQFLHASSLRFSFGKRLYSFSSPLPKGLKDFLQKLIEIKK